MLRGIQTPGELKQRVDRLHRFDDLAAVHETLEKLIAGGHVARLERRPGQKEERYEQLLGGGDEPPSTDEPPPEATSAPEDRLERLERELTELQAQMRELREALGDSAAPPEGV